MYIERIQKLINAAYLLDIINNTQIKSLRPTSVSKELTGGGRNRHGNSQVFVSGFYSYSNNITHLIQYFAESI